VLLSLLHATLVRLVALVAVTVLATLVAFTVFCALGAALLARTLAALMFRVVALLSWLGAGIALLAALRLVLATVLLRVVVALLSLLATGIALLATLTLTALLCAGPGILVSGLARMLASALFLTLLLVILIRCISLLARIVFATRLILVRILMSLLRRFYWHDVSPFDLIEFTAQIN
jgi:hypothetical protein